MRKNNLHAFSLRRRNLQGVETIVIQDGLSTVARSINSKPHGGREQLQQTR